PDEVNERLLPLARINGLKTDGHSRRKHIASDDAHGRAVFPFHLHFAARSHDNAHCSDAVKVGLLPFNGVEEMCGASRADRNFAGDLARESFFARALIAAVDAIPELQARSGGRLSSARPREQHAIFVRLCPKICGRRQRNDCRHLHTIGRSSSASAAVQYLDGVCEFGLRIIAYSIWRKRVHESLRRRSPGLRPLPGFLSRDRGRWNGCNRILARSYVRFDTAADSGRPQRAQTLMVCGQCWFAPGQSYEVPFARNA